MGQRRPVGAGDVAAFRRLLPQMANVAGAAGAFELADRQTMTAIEGLVQQLGALLVFTGDQHGAGMDIVLAGLERLLAADLDQHAAQFAGRQAGADDRAMQIGAKFPQFRSLPLGFGFCGCLARPCRQQRLVPDRTRQNRTEQRSRQGQWGEEWIGHRHVQLCIALGRFRRARDKPRGAREPPICSFQRPAWLMNLVTR